MRFSIKLKLFLLITCLITFYVLLSVFLNKGLLSKYYLFIKKNELKENFKLINKQYDGTINSVELQIEKIERTQGMHIVILNKDYETKYDSRPLRGAIGYLIPGSSYGQRMIRNSIRGIVEEKAQTIKKDKIVIEKATYYRLNSDFINLYALMNNGDYIYISTPVEAIEESVDISNQFYLFTGALTILIGTVAVFLLSGRFTKPILEMNKIAQRMAVLDFSRKYLITTHDEIGELGQSINSMSEQLEKSISELKDANEKLKEDIEKERKIDEMRKEFLSNVSHELKTPIALIQGYAEGLKINVNDDEENKNFYCDVISDEAANMNRLVKQLLDLSAMESGDADLDRVDFQLSLLIDAVIKKNALIFKSKGIKAQVQSKDDFRVNGDYYRVEAVLMNYISNALNHVDDKKVIRIRTEQNLNKVRVYVYNTGEHIPDSSKDKIWNSFYKVDKARTRAYGGTGLGLSIVRAIQEAHKNKYGFENIQDGIEFWFELDIQAP